MSRRGAIRGLGLAGLGLGAAAVLGCGGEEKPKAEAPLEVTSLRLPQTPALCDSAQYLAEKYLSQEGFTEVKFVPFQPPKTSFALVSAGEADFGTDGINNLVARVDAGESLTFLGGFHTGCGAVFGNASIKTVADFKGRTIGVTGTDPLVNIDYNALHALLGNAGLDPAKDVTFTTRPGPVAQFGQAFNEGKYDGFFTAPPGIYQARAANLGHEVVNLMRDKPWSDNYCCGVVANRAFAQKNPVATKRALRALLKASDEAASQPEQAARYIVDKGYRPSYDDMIASFKEMMHNRWRDMDHEASFRLHTINLKAGGLVKGSADKLVSDGANLSFLSELRKAKA